MPTDARPQLVPGPDHPIVLERPAVRVVVRHGAVTVAATERPLEMRESTYPPVLYVPLDDVDRRALRPSDHHTYCPYKGEASYYDILGAGGDLGAAAWYYDTPYPAVADIAGHVAFYADRVIVTVTPI